MYLAHKITLDPTMKQRKLFSMAAGCARFAYNWGLNWWDTEYKAGRKPTALKAKKAFNQIKHEQFPWISLSPKDANQDAFDNLNAAFQRFFKKQNKYPSFKKRKDHASFGVSNDQFRFEGRKIRLPKIGWVKLFEELRFSGKIMSATVSRTADRWYVSVAVEVAPTTTTAKTKHSVVGVDLGLTNPVVVSDGSVFQYPKPLKANLRRLEILQRSVSRKQKGSNRRDKACRKVARLHARIASIRKDCIHKITTTLVRQHSVIGIEDLNVRGMMRNHKNARATADVSYAEFRRHLEYKAKLNNCEVVVVSRWFPSSQICSKCGHRLVKKLGRGERMFVCEKCDFRGDRDLNAALNLSTAGYAGSHAQGQTVSPLRNSVAAGLVELRTKPRNEVLLVSTN